MQKITNTTYPNLVAEKANISKLYKDNAELLSSYLIEEFMELCKIPHPSGHVEQMREYLVKWAKKNNVDVFLDSSGCVVMDLAATENCKDYPKVILQCHFDMVAVGASTNKSFSPTTSPICPVLDKQHSCIHTNWKTSLGADNGQGIATCMAIIRAHNNANNNIEHGPIRMLFTYDEETNMQGVQNLSSDVLDTKYLINLDSIYVGMVINGASGAYYGTISKKMQLINAGKKGRVFTWEIGGLLGGHSGEDIHKGRGSVVVLLTRFMLALARNDITFNLCDIDAGTFMNAIPAKLKAKFIIGSSYVDKAAKIADKIITNAKEEYVDGKTLWQRTNIDIAYANPMLSISDSLKLLDILSNIPNGVQSFNEKGKPVTSCNIGLVNLHNGEIKIKLLQRSLYKAKLDISLDKLKTLCRRNKMDCTIEGVFPGWDKLDVNPLNDLILKSYEDSCNFKGVSLDIHSGLECGYLHQKYPKLIMASIGCDLVNEHTVKETLFTKSIPTYFASLLYVLEKINTLSQ